MIWGVAALLIAGAQAFSQPQPPDAALLMKHAMEVRASGDLPGALKELRRAAILKPSLPGVHREIGLILIEQREFASAGDELRASCSRRSARLLFALRSRAVLSQCQQDS